jgi:hypothetical protein
LAAHGLDALAHAAQAVALFADAAAAVVFDDQSSAGAIGRKFQTAAAGLGVADNICNSFAHDQGEDGFFGWG